VACAPSPGQAISLGRRIPRNAWIWCVVSLFGLALLCLKSHLEFVPGDLLVLGGAFFWTAQIILVERFSPLADPAWIAFWQFLTCSVLSLETVFATIGGLLFLGERLGARELSGCALMLSGMVVSQSGAAPIDRG
jgi:drug/metabolite transporter (DMT)-like permease